MFGLTFICCKNFATDHIWDNIAEKWYSKCDEYILQGTVFGNPT